LPDVARAPIPGELEGGSEEGLELDGEVFWGGDGGGGREEVEAVCYCVFGEGSRGDTLEGALEMGGERVLG